LGALQFHYIMLFSKHNPLSMWLIIFLIYQALSSFSSHPKQPIRTLNLISNQVHKARSHKGFIN
jgi:hypothetical protein